VAQEPGMAGIRSGEQLVDEEHYKKFNQFLLSSQSLRSFQSFIKVIKN